MNGNADPIEYVHWAENENLQDQETGINGK